jgi:AAA ATPase-like protein/adenylate/guanylate cyclase family protein
MALFGAPVANEDHAQRALSAALAIQRGLQPLADEVRRLHGVEFRMRMGINTGRVVVGAIGRDLRMDYTAVGDTTNLAARLLGIAQPGQIVASQRTQRLSAGFFVFEDLGEFQVKGKQEPVRAYAVSHEISGQTRLEVSRERGLTPLVGREQELEALAGLQRQATEGQSAIALLVGDAGVGKSRLLYEFLHRLEAGVLDLETNCASYGRSMAYRPIVELLRRYLGLAEGSSDGEIRSRVTEQLQFLGLAGEERSLLLTHFLGVSAPPEFLNRLSSAQLKVRLLGVLRDVFLGASELVPLILIVENMHWIDSASEEFLAHLAADLPGHRVLLVLTTRPGYTAAWLAAPLAQTITLAGLGTGDVQGMVWTLLAVEEGSAPLCQLLADMRAFAESCLAHVCLAAGDLHDGLKAGVRALGVFEARGNLWWACRTFWALIPLANALGDYQRALDYCDRALAHATTMDDARLKVVAHMRRGSTEIQRGHVERGLRACQQAAALSAGPFDAMMLKAMGAAGRMKTSDVEGGVAELAEAVTWFEPSGLQYTHAVCGLRLADSYRHLGDRARARALARRCWSQPASEVIGISRVGPSARWASRCPARTRAPSPHTSRALPAFSPT